MRQGAIAALTLPELIASVGDRVKHMIDFVTSDRMQTMIDAFDSNMVQTEGNVTVSAGNVLLDVVLAYLVRTQH
jgi:hypothetical protein